jgi:DNA repair protein RecO (recombination protein O)
MICSTPAFVLRTYDFRETSKIVTFFSKDFGKLRGILKGIRKDPKKFSSTLSPLSLNHIVFYKKRTSEIHLVGQCDMIDDFGLSSGALDNFGYASFAAELTDLLLPLEDVNRDVFALVFDFLNTLKRTPQDTRSIFAIKILALSGFKPHFDSCLICGVQLTQRAHFSHAKGGLLCMKCLYHDKNAVSILPGTIASILYMERSNFPSCLRLHTMPAVKNELNRILDCFIHFHVGKTLKSAKAIHEILDLK